MEGVIPLPSTECFAVGLFQGLWYASTSLVATKPYEALLVR